MATQVIMPQLGESVVEGTVMQWFKHEGDQIDEYESLLEVNTDKVNSEIPSPAAGVVLRILVAEGETVKAGSIIAWIGKPGETVEGSSPVQVAKGPQPMISTAEVNQAKEAPASASSERDLGFISPVVAKIAREHNLDLHAVKGSGEGGRITKKDVLAYLDGNPGPAISSGKLEPAAWETPGEGDLFRPTELMFANNLPPAPPATKSVPTGNMGQTSGVTGRLVPLSPMRKRIADHMVFSRHTSPHVTTVMEVDLKKVVAHRETNKPLFARDGVSLTFTAYFMAAAAAALRAFPLVNSTWRDDGVWIHGSVNIGMATSLGEEGLIVPVIKQADGLSLLGLARTVNDLAARARDHRLQPDEVQGGTFTITNHGTGGSLFAMPIINQPQCAILGVGAIQKRVVVLKDDSIAVRPMVYLTLTFDHRILDGDSADKFLGKIVSVLQEWE